MFVLKLPIRPPALVAKQAGSLAALFDNRLGLGVGTSPWSEDYELMDVPFARRGKRMDECIEIIKGLTTGEYFEFHGEFYDIPKTKMSPAPTQPIPILIGGHADVALRRAARNDGWMHGGGDLGDPEALDRYIKRLNELREEEGQTGPFEIHAMSLDAYKPDGIKRLEDRGVTNIMVGFRMPYIIGPDTEPLGEQDPRHREVRREGHRQGVTCAALSAEKRRSVNGPEGVIGRGGGNHSIWPTRREQQDGTPSGVVAVGASAGGVEALTGSPRVCRGNCRTPSSWCCTCRPTPPACWPRSSTAAARCPPPQPQATAHLARGGHMYVAAPDRHLLVFDHRIVLSEGPDRERLPARDQRAVPFGRAGFGPRAIGVLMSGVLDDGVLGLAAIRAGAESRSPRHPTTRCSPRCRSTPRPQGVVDHQVPAAGIGALLAELANARSRSPMDLDEHAMELENRIAMGRKFSTAFDTEALGPPSGYTCPDCNGSLMTVSDAQLPLPGRPRVDRPTRCSTRAGRRGRGALWVALRSLQEKAKLSRHAGREGPATAHVPALHRMAEEAEHASTVLGEAT